MIAPWRREPEEQETLAARICRMLTSNSVLSLDDLLELTDEDIASLDCALDNLVRENEITELRPMCARQGHAFVYYRKRQAADAAWQHEHRQHRHKWAGSQDRKHIDPV